jgi:bla regulator protein blaR1
MILEVFAGIHLFENASVVRLENGIADHLWQSTIFAVAIAASTLVFRRNRAGLRFGLWLAASVKFLVPFAWLIGLGNWIASFRNPGQAQGGILTVVEQVSQPFTRTGFVPERSAGALPHLFVVLPPALAAMWLLGTLSLLAFWWMRWRRVSHSMRQAVSVDVGREVDMLRRLESLAAVIRPVAFRLSPESMEPGIFGIFRPTLIWPDGISAHLDDGQLQAILAHELWHVRRRDNLAAVLQMLVEAVFWFHPLVWWIGARLMEERERACDEEVVRLGNEAEVYAASILNACKFCVEVPLSCVSGVAGSNLKRRIVHIMNRETVYELTLIRKLGLAAMATIVVAGPVVFGVVRTPPVNAQSFQPAADARQTFDSVSIKPNHSAGKLDQLMVRPDQFIYANVSVKKLITFAYGVEEYQLLGAPDWTETERFDVEATWHPVNPREAGASIPPPPPPPQGALAVPMSQLGPGQLQAMVKTLLAERFGLKLRQQSQDLPVYDLVVASTGAKLTQTPSTPPPPSFNGEPIISVRTMINTKAGELSLSNGPVSAFAGFLSGQFGRQVVDKTGLKGNYDVTLRWTPGQDATESIVAALQDQLGLTLESQHGPVPVLVIDQVERPS